MVNGEWLWEMLTRFGKYVGIVGREHSSPETAPPLSLRDVSPTGSTPALQINYECLDMKSRTSF